MTKQEKIVALRERVKALKTALYQVEDWRSKLLRKYPEYDTIQGGNFVINVLNLRSTDEELTLRLEEIIEEAKIVKV